MEEFNDQETFPSDIWCLRELVARYVLFVLLGCFKAGVQNLMETGIKNLVYMFLVPYHDTITMKFKGLM